eukprot:364716-Chlamydomonas_euryale.AAC.6
MHHPWCILMWQVNNLHGSYRVATLGAQASSSPSRYAPLHASSGVLQIPLGSHNSHCELHFLLIARRMMYHDGPYKTAPWDSPPHHPSPRTDCLLISKVHAQLKGAYRWGKSTQLEPM